MLEPARTPSWTRMIRKQRTKQRRPRWSMRPRRCRGVRWSPHGDAALRARQSELGVPAADEPETSPAVVVSKALAYLEKHQDKMKHDEYRRAGLPITSSLMESAVKQINQRVKGSEKFWSEQGSEAVLQLRADQLSDGEILETFWLRHQAEATGQRRYRRSA